MIAPNSLHPSDVVLRLVESVGRRSDADFYVQLFRKLPKSAFAIVAPGASSLLGAQGLVIEHLRFLGHLGLNAPVVLGLFQPAAAKTVAAQFEAALRAAGLPGNHYDAAAPGLDATLHTDLNAGQTPLVSFYPNSGWSQSRRFELLGQWARTLTSRKLVLVRAQGGLGPHTPGSLSLGPGHCLPVTEKGISVIGLHRDLVPLVRSGHLEDEETSLLRDIHSAMRLANQARRGNHKQPGAPDPLLTSIASPTNLLHELFTVKGAGTLIKPGSKIEVHQSYDRVQLPRLQHLLETTFNKPLARDFFSRKTAAVYLESRYRGAAIVQADDAEASFLTKFVVGRLAQGMGLGRDLWDLVTAEHPALFWRSRADNPVNAWYESLCDGRTRTNRWIVYWRGVEPEQIPALVHSAQSKPIDFVEDDHPHPRGGEQ